MTHLLIALLIATLTAWQVQVCLKVALATLQEPPKTIRGVEEPEDCQDGSCQISPPLTPRPAPNK